MDRTLGDGFNSCEVMGWSCFFQPIPTKGWNPGGAPRLGHEDRRVLMGQRGAHSPSPT